MDNEEGNKEETILPLTHVYRIQSIDDFKPVVIHKPLNPLKIKFLNKKKFV